MPRYYCDTTCLADHHQSESSTCRIQAQGSRNSWDKQRLSSGLLQLIINILWLRGLSYLYYRHLSYLWECNFQMHP
ncbi:uncharacterized protein LOC116213231 isoform X2 [Punica granatum]|uniref:Uncharacterized protein LOC116213231 isoform X2 n=1 Tax=Punica granatum TaxID=22663 RepID=A0A6P8EEY4_PUNGR|nr:uncharacterized protein LOC116213231 isoform X2 [Punica granatum]